MDKLNRRTFLEGTLAVSAGLGVVNNGPSAAGSESVAKAVADLPKRKLGKYDVSRLIIGANQFTGFPHAEPLKYAKELFAAYFTEAKIVETLAIARDHGITGSQDRRVARSQDHGTTGSQDRITNSY